MVVLKLTMIRDVIGGIVKRIRVLCRQGGKGRGRIEGAGAGR